MKRVWLHLLVAGMLSIFSGGLFLTVQTAQAVDQGRETSDEVNEAAQQMFQQLLRTLQQVMNNLEQKVVKEGRVPAGEDEDERLGRIPENATLDENLDRAFFLDRVEELDLSSKQVSVLKRIRAEYQRDSIRLGAELKIAELELRELLEKDWNLEQAEGMVRRILQVQGDMQVRHLRAVRDSLDVLTSKQKETLNKMR